MTRSSLASNGAGPDLSHEGATGFDAIALREEAGRGLLATLNRGTVKMN